jgi:hypothetical protein
LGLFVSQVMAKHRKNVHKLVKTSRNLTKDTFLCEQDIQNIAKKLAKKTYKKHDNNAKNVHMWAQKNPNILIYNQKSGSKVGGELSSRNISFTIGIQTP